MRLSLDKFLYGAGKLSAFLLCFGSVAGAQIAVSVGVQEIYDDNVFLEDDLGAFTAEAREEIELLPPEQQELFELPERQNGEPDDAFITNLSLGLSGGSPVGKYLRLTFDATGGLVFFSGVDDQDRWSLDSLVELTPEEYVLPPWLFISASSVFQTDSFDVGVSEGALARQTTRHIAGLTTRASKELSKTIGSSLEYRLQQTNSLGQTTLNSAEDEENLPEFLEDDDDGSDFLSHTFALSISKQFSAKTQGRIGASLQLIEFSGSDSLDNDNFNDEIDRQIFGASANLTHAFSNSFSIYGGAGLSRTSFDEARQGIEVVNLDTAEGVAVTRTAGSDDTPTNLTFSAGFDYLPSQSLAIGAGINQSVGLNAQGAEVGVRTTNLTLTYIANNRLSFTAAGQHFETANDDQIDIDGLERLSSTLSASYNITPSLSISAGWSFTDQDSGQGEEVLDGLLFRSENYDSNRFFLSLNKGLVGLPL